VAGAVPPPSPAALAFGPNAQRIPGFTSIPHQRKTWLNRLGVFHLELEVKDPTERLPPAGR